jgi:hypothetical protein
LTIQDVGGIDINVPVGWTLVPAATGPVGDHSDYFFHSPADLNAQLLIVSNRCTGCLSGATATSLIGGDGTNVQTYSPSFAGFQTNMLAQGASSILSGQVASSLPAGYETNGAVVINPQTQLGPAWAFVEVSTPATEHSSASLILNSVAFVDPPADSTSPGYTSAYQAWQQGATEDAADQTGTWQEAANDLQNGETSDPGNTAGYAAIVEYLQNLISIPLTNASTAQQAEASTDIYAINTFFGTPSLYD